MSCGTVTLQIIVALFLHIFSQDDAINKIREVLNLNPPPFTFIDIFMRQLISRRTIQHILAGFLPTFFY